MLKSPSSHFFTAAVPDAPAEPGMSTQQSVWQAIPEQASRHRQVSRCRQTGASPHTTGNRDCTTGSTEITATLLTFQSQWKWGLITHCKLAQVLLSMLWRRKIRGQGKGREMVSCDMHCEMAEHFYTHRRHVSDCLYTIKGHRCYVCLAEYSQ